jgi:hypothetical protein
MRLSTASRLVLCGLLLALAVPGCGIRQAAQRQQRSNQLKIIGPAYHDFLDANAGKAPTQASDLQQYVGDAAAYQALTDGSFVLLYGVKLADMTAGSGNTILGYDAGTPQGGGFVLMGDGSVRTVTAQEFQSMPQAKPKK